jgi:hypothetical protein
MAVVVKAVGANQEDLYDVIKELGNKIKEAEEGNETYRTSLDRIGLSYHMLSMLTPEQQLYHFADGLKRASSEAQKLSIDELVSDPGMRMITVLNKGSDSLKTMMADAEKTGKSLKAIEFEQLKELDDQFRKSREEGEKLAKALVVELAPAIKFMGESLQDSVRGWGIVISKFKEFNAEGEKIIEAQKKIKQAESTKNLFQATSSAGVMLPKVSGSLLDVAKEAKATTQQMEFFTASMVKTDRIIAQTKDSKYDPTRLPTMVVTGDDQPTAPFFGPENLEVQRDILEQAMFDYQQYREQIGTMQADYNAQMYQDEKRNQDAHRMLWESSWKGKAKITSDILDNLSTLMNSKSRKMFEIGKVAATSGAIIDTIVAAQRSYTALAGIPVVGPALGAAAAGAAILAGMVRVQQIQSTSFGGGGGAGGGGAGPGVAGTPQPAEVINQTNVDVSLQGSSFTGDQVRGLISSINGAISDGAKLNSITVK